VIGEQGLLNKNKVLRHGKEIQSGEVGDLTDQIKQVLFWLKHLVDAARCCNRVVMKI
jgi:hypothetical protein